MHHRSDDPWHVRQSRLDLHHPAAAACVLTLSNGYLGVRAVPERPGHGHGPGTLLASRMGCAINRALELDTFIATREDEYVARAVGDVIAARAKGEAVDDGAWGAHATTAQQRAVTQVVFTDPEVCAVGLTADQARDAGLRTRVVDLDIAVAGSALHADGYTGWARMVVDEDRRVVVGVTFVGQDTAELLHSATVAVVGEVPLERLWHAVPSYPTTSEVWLRLLESYGL